MNAKQALDTICHTSKRVQGGSRLYTLADDRFPELSGRRIRVTREHGQVVYAWWHDQIKCFPTRPALQDGPSA